MRSKLRFKRLKGVEKARLVSHFFAALWPIVFLMVQPASYSIISDLFIHLWMPLAVVAAIASAIGVLTRIDLKLELPALYMLLVGPVIYWVAQIGLIFSSPDGFDNRFALSFFVIWHISLLLPRLVELENIRRRERLKAKSRL